MGVLKKELKKYYRVERVVHRLTPLTKIKKFTVEVLGPFLNPDFKGKAAESRGLLKFATQVAQRLAPRDHKMYLLAKSGALLCRFMQILKQESRRVPVDKQIELMRCAVQHILLFRAAGGICTPKYHRLPHIVRAIWFSGNPSFYSTYEDESENGMIAIVCSKVHGDTFARSVFERILVDENIIYIEV